jgi:putative ABC transport system permease protein
MTDNRSGVRWYRRLLRLYPQDFREEFGGEMTRLYVDRRGEEPWWSLWTTLVLDLLRTAPLEHFTMLRQDLRYSWRSLSRTPIIAATAILTLALGVGASTAVFSVVHAVLLRPLPYPEADRLVELFESNLNGSTRASALNYLSWAEEAKSFDAIAAFNGAGMTLSDDGDPELLSGSFVTASLFNVLRVPALVGRGLQSDDEHAGSSRVVVLSEQLWRTRYGGDGSIVGRSITLDGQRYRVVGVMPGSFREVGRAQASGSAAGQIFLPMVIDRTQESRGNHTLRVVGRLRRGVSLEQARNEMRVVSARLEQEFPATNTHWGVGIERLTDTMLEPEVHRSLLLVLGAVILVLLIACTNIANLMLARGTQRGAELALRTALGAGRSRLVRQLLTESSCLAVTSGAAGVLMAAIAHPLIRAWLPPTLPRLDETRVDVQVLAFGLLISIASGIVFGIIPALRATRLVPSQSLVLAGRATTESSRARLRQLLTAAQVALATMLLVGAALMLQGLVRLQRVPLGFQPDGVLTARISLPLNAYASAERTGGFYERLVTSLEASGQLGPVALATSAPFAPGVRASFQPRRLRESGRAAATDVTGEHAAEHIVNGTYFQVIGIPLLAGRVFSERDRVGTPPVAIVSQQAARLFWPDMSPLGQIVERDGGSFEVIGVVGDIRGSDTRGPLGGGPDRESRAAVYFAAGQRPQRTMTLLVRPSSEPAVISRVRYALRELDPTLALRQVRPLQEWLSESLAPTRFTTLVAAIFAVSALLLASVGIFGVLAYTVASRTREIGVRMAIGATRGRVLRLVLGQGMTWAGLGIAVGLIGAFAAARFMATLLFDIPARDPMTFAAIAGVVALVAFAASAIPAVRAVHIDPTIAMRGE